MKHNEKTTKAIEESIAHHEKNLHDLETLEGEFRKDGCYFYIDRYEIPFHDKVCVLCQKFRHSTKTPCEKCPLSIIGEECMKDTSPWKAINNSKTHPEAIEATKGMIKALRGLVEEEFKKEDEVKIVKKAGNIDSCRPGIYWHPRMNATLGMTGKIISVVSGPIYMVKCKSGAIWTYLPESLQKITSLSPHAKLKARIDAITCDTSLREVDEISMKIIKTSPFISQESIKKTLTRLLERSDLKDTCPECKGSKVCSHCEGK